MSTAGLTTPVKDLDGVDPTTAAAPAAPAAPARPVRRRAPPAKAPLSAKLSALLELGKEAAGPTLYTGSEALTEPPLPEAAGRFVMGAEALYAHVPITCVEITQRNGEVTVAPTVPALKFLKATAGVAWAAKKALARQLENFLVRLVRDHGQVWVPEPAGPAGPVDLVAAAQEIFKAADIAEVRPTAVVLFTGAQ